MTLAVCLPGYGEVGLWLVYESKRSGKWVITDKLSNHYVPRIRESFGDIYQNEAEIGLGALPIYSLKLFLNMGESTAMIEGIGSIAPITETRFEKWVEI